MEDIRKSDLKKKQEMLDKAYKTVATFRSQSDDGVSQTDYRKAKQTIARVKTAINEQQGDDNE